MERDRDAALTLKAAVRGSLDFSKADVKDHGWWLKWRYVIRTLAAQEHEELIGNLYSLSLALLANPKMDAGTEHKNTLERYRTLRQAKQPWAEMLEEKYRRSEHEEYKVQWKQLTGWDPSDSAAREKWEDEVRQATKGKREERETQAQEEQARLNNFHAAAEEIRRKRLKQQGRSR